MSGAVAALGTNLPWTTEAKYEPTNGWIMIIPRWTTLLIEEDFLLSARVAGSLKLFLGILLPPMSVRAPTPMSVYDRRVASSRSSPVFVDPFRCFLAFQELLLSE